MPKASPIYNSFTRGEVSPLIEGQINLQGFFESNRLVQNLITLKQGPLVRRGGTKFVKEVKDSSDDTALIPFQFNVSQSYQIEMGDQYFRFYTNYGVITETAQNITGVTQANAAVVTYSGADNYANGDEVYISAVAGMTELNDKFYRVANVNTGSNTFEITDIDGTNIDSTGFTAYSSGGTLEEVYEISSPYNASDIYNSNGAKNFQHAQSADVLYIAHGDFNTRSLGRSANTNWTLNDMTFDDGPYLDENTTSTTLTLSGTSGSVTVTANSTTGINDGDGFQTTDVGRLIRWKDPANNWTWLEITARSSTTVVTATIQGANASAGTATTSWRLGVYSDTTGYPTVITFFQDRVFLAGASSYPDRYDLTKTGGYSDTDFLFAPSNADGTITDDSAISGTLQSGQVNTIQWASSDDRGLIIGTAGREWILRPSSNNEVLTPSNAKADPFSAVGSSYVQPIQAESGTLFVQRARRKIHDIIYSFNLDQLKPRDLTVLCEHITRSGIVELQFQQEPINVVWMRRNDGTLIGFTYYPDENVFAAHRHSIGGTNAKVKSISVIQSPDTSREDLWMIVERTVNSVTRKYVEYMTRYYEDDIAKSDAFHVDSGLTYSGAATATVTGLDHLEGETVKILRDGNSHPDLTVSDGSVTLANDRTGTKIQVGLGNTWALETQRIEAGAADGTAQGKTKRITRFVIRLLNTLGLKYGPSSSELDEYDFDQGAEYDENLALFSGDTESIKWPDGYTQDGTMYFTNDGVFPAGIIAIMPQLKTQDRG